MTMSNGDTKILPHHEAAARMWGQGGRLRARGERRISDIDSYHRHYQTPLGLHVKREYLVTVGIRT
jgi:hypothetical protein